MIGVKMQQNFDKSDCIIILKSNSVENSSEYWQDQCYQLYNLINRSLPVGCALEPSSCEGSEGERVDQVTIFSTLAAFGITGKVFFNVILDSIKIWLEYRPTVEIELKCPDGTMVKISKLPLSKLSNFFKENPQLSVCEGLHKFNIINK